MSRATIFGLLLLLGMALPASAQLRLQPGVTTASAVTVTTVDVTTASATGGGAAVDATLAVGFQHGLITDCAWEPVSNASVDSVVIALYADSGHTKLLNYITGSAISGVNVAKPLPTIAGTGGASYTVPAVHDSDDTNAYMTVANKTGGQDGTIKITCTFLRDS